MVVVVIVFVVVADDDIVVDPRNLPLKFGHNRVRQIPNTIKIYQKSGQK